MPHYTFIIIVYHRYRTTNIYRHSMSLVPHSTCTTKLSPSYITGTTPQISDLSLSTENKIYRSLPSMVTGITLQIYHHRRSLIRITLQIYHHRRSMVPHFKSTIIVDNWFNTSNHQFDHHRRPGTTLQSYNHRRLLVSQFKSIIIVDHWYHNSNLSSS